MRRVHVVVTGNVQGVGYRYSLRMRAHAAHVNGWARNRLAGTVEAELEGDPEQVDALLAWMEQGPPGSSVSGVHVRELSPVGATAFEVLPTL